MNVQVSDDCGNSMYLRFMPRGALPTGDTMLAQKIALELFETDALQIANLALGSAALRASIPSGSGRLVP
jgi:hypothetical protein